MIDDRFSNKYGSPTCEQQRIWTPDELGKERLLALAEVGLGAIYVGYIDAPFTYKSLQNKVIAHNSGAGLFVKNNGTISTIK